MYDRCQCVSWRTLVSRSGRLPRRPKEPPYWTLGASLSPALTHFNWTHTRLCALGSTVPGVPYLTHPPKVPKNPRPLTSGLPLNRVFKKVTSSLRSSDKTRKMADELLKQAQDVFEGQIVSPWQSQYLCRKNQRARAALLRLGNLVG